MSKREPMHPGEVFTRRFIGDAPLLNKSKAARMLGVSRQSLINFCSGSARLTPAFASRLAKATGTGVSVWLTMAANYDSWHAEQTIEHLDVEPFNIGAKG